MSCSILLPVCCGYKHHTLHSLTHKGFHFKIRCGFEFDQTNDNFLLKHSGGSRVSLCNENLRFNSVLLIRSPGLRLHGYCGGLVLAGSQSSTHTLAHSLHSGWKGENKKSRNKKAASA